MNSKEVLLNEIITALKIEMINQRIKARISRLELLKICVAKCKEANLDEKVQDFVSSAMCINECIKQLSEQRNTLIFDLEGVKGVEQ